MIARKKKKRIKLPLSAYLIYLLMCSLLLTGVSFSKYISTANGSDSARVAAFVVEMHTNDNKELSIDCDDPTNGYDTSFTFSVQNYKNNQDSEQNKAEVAMQYKVKIVFPDNLPTDLKVELHKKAGNQTTLVDGSKDGTIYTYQIPEMVFNTSVSETHEYVLKINATDVIDDESIKLNGIKVSAIVEQID